MDSQNGWERAQKNIWFNLSFSRNLEHIAAEPLDESVLYALKSATGFIWID